MKSLFLTASLLFLLTTPSALQNPETHFDLPALHSIREATLSPSYSCRSAEEFKKGYANTALFLSDYSKHFNSPELLFNGACDSQDYLQGGQGGPDSSVIADLGRVRLEDLRTIQAFNVQRLHVQNLYSRFTGQIEPDLGHTYALLIDRRDERGLVYFTITGYVPNQRLDLRYVVKHFELMRVVAESPGFDWNK